MKRKFLVIAISLLIPFLSQAQSAEQPETQTVAPTGIDLGAIEVEITMNPAAYRNMLERYNQGDTTLTTDDMPIIYYGQGFTMDYDPNATYPLLTDAYERKDYATVTALIPDLLPYNPMSLDLLIMGLVSATREQNPDNIPLIETLQHRLDLVVGTILSSGKGTTADSPLYVASTADLLQILKNIIGVKEILGTSGVGTADVVAYKFHIDDSQRQHILYFDNTLQNRFDREKGIK